MWIWVKFVHFISHDSWMLIYISCVVTMPSAYYTIVRYGKNEVCHHTRSTGWLSEKENILSIKTYFNIWLCIMSCYVCHYVSFLHFGIRRQCSGQYQENHISLYGTLRFINCVHIYVRTDKFCLAAYVYVDGRSRKCIWHCLLSEMGFLGTRVRIQPSPFSSFYLVATALKHVLMT